MTKFPKRIAYLLVIPIIMATAGYLFDLGVKTPNDNDQHGGLIGLALGLLLAFVASIVIGVQDWIEDA